MGMRASAMLVPLPLEQIEIDVPVPVSLWDGRGRLLLRGGETVRSERERAVLCLHGPHVRAADYKAWTYGYTTRLDQLVRADRSLHDLARVRLPADFRPPAPAAAGEDDPVQAWPDLHSTVTLMQRQSNGLSDLLQRLDTAEQRMRRLLDSQPDRSLFMLTQMLQDPQVGYCAAHALASAAASLLVARALLIGDEEQRALLRAALTMNIGISRFMDDLRRPSGDVTPAQLRAVQEHPLRGMLLLHRLGVTDPLWLELVRDHHEMPDGSGYPAGKHLQQALPQNLLRLADIMFEHIGLGREPGGSTPLSTAPARRLLLDDQGRPNPLGAAFLRTLGLYLPGTFVQLASGETAIVVRRGAKATTPRVLTLVNRQGLPLGEPVSRDCAEPGCEVVAAVPAQAVKVLVSPGKLLARA